MGKGMQGLPQMGFVVQSDEEYRLACSQFGPWYAKRMRAACRGVTEEAGRQACLNLLSCFERNQSRRLARNENVDDPRHRMGI